MSSSQKKSPFYLGGMATMGACLFTNPFEVVKVRMQLDGELQATGSYSKRYSNAGNAFASIYKKEGIRGLQAGLGSALLYQAVMNGARLGLFEPIKSKLNELDVHGEHVLGCRVLAGSSAGAIGAAIGSPLYLAKTRMQAKSSGKYHYKHTLDCFRSIYTADGIRGLWRGVTASIPRVAVGSGIQLSTYDTTKAYVVDYTGMEESSMWTHVTASLVTGVVVTLGMNPLDVVSTRMYSQPVKNHVGLLYSNIFDCLFKIVRTEGFFSLYKGFWAHYARIGPHTVLTFVFWESLKTWTGRYDEDTDGERLLMRTTTDPHS